MHAYMHECIFQYIETKESKGPLSAITSVYSNKRVKDYVCFDVGLIPLCLYRLKFLALIQQFVSEV